MELELIARSGAPALRVRINRGLLHSVEYGLWIVRVEGGLEGELRWKVDYPLEQSGTCRVPMSDIEKLISGLRATHMPPVVDFSMGLDGETTELSYGDSWGGAVFRWWGNAPQAWSPLSAAVDTVKGWAGLDLPDDAFAGMEDPEADEEVL